MIEKFINSFDESKVFCRIWDKIEKPIGVIQIFHGLAEHGIRYDELANELNKNGYIVICIDERCHGKTALKYGQHEKDDAFKNTVNDQIFISRKIKEKYKLPLYIFAHSYGTFICQSYITKCNLYDKVIMCASAFMHGRADIKFGLFISWLGKIFKKNKPAKLIEKINYSTYFKKVKSGHWISSNDDVVKKYYDDPMCGKPLSYNFYHSMFANFKQMYKRKLVSNINKTKPILLLCGNKDPVGDMSKSVIKLYDFYKQLGLNVHLKIYPNARHEIFNETLVKVNVHKDIISFLKNKN